MTRRSVWAALSFMALLGCSSSDPSSVVTPTPTPTGGATSTPSPAPVVAAGACPTLMNGVALADRGVRTGPTGSYRICALPGRIAASTTLVRVTGLVYSIEGNVYVGTDRGGSSTGSAVTLTIEPGVIAMGEFNDTSSSTLFVTRGNRIDAVGTATQPIIFTGYANIVNGANDQREAMWGGIVIAGRAPLANCNSPVIDPGTAQCENGVNIGNAFGGAQADDDSGRIRYVQLRYTGRYGLAFHGVGYGTTVDHIQVHNAGGGTYDGQGVTLNGGTVNMKHVAVTGARGTAIVAADGYRGFIQFLVVVQRFDGPAADALFIADSRSISFFQNLPHPRTFPRVTNATFVQRGVTDRGSFIIRGGADTTMVNAILSVQQPSPPPCLYVEGDVAMQAAGAGPLEEGPPKFRAVAMTCSQSRIFAGMPPPSDAAVEAVFRSDASNRTGCNCSLDGIYPTSATAPATLPPFDASTLNDPVTAPGFFVATTHVGALQGAGDTSFQGWTCESATLSFGGAGTRCAALP